MDYAKLDALIEARRDEFLKDLGRWLSVPSVQGAAEAGAPFGWSTARLYERMARPFGEQGIEVEHLPLPDGTDAFAQWKDRFGTAR